VLLADVLLDGYQGRALPVLEGQDSLQVSKLGGIVSCCQAQPQCCLPLDANWPRCNSLLSRRTPDYRCITHTDICIGNTATETAGMFYAPQQPGRQLVGEQA
jgi:hypothetical protein